MKIGISKIVILAGLVFLLTSSGLHGRAFFQGEFVDIPSSELLPHMAFEGDLAMHLYFSKDFNHSKGSQNISAGLYNWVQLGVTLESEQHLLGNACLKVFHETRYIPAITIGIQNISGKSDISQFGSDFVYPHDQNNSMYAAFSKHIDYLPGLPITLQLGIGSGRFVGATERSEWLHGIFAGVAVWPSSRICLTIEEDGKDINAGALLKLHDHLALRFAVTDIEQAYNPNLDVSIIDAGAHTKFVFGLSYQFNQFRPKLSKKETLIETLRNERSQNLILKEEIEELRKRRGSVEKDLEILREHLLDGQDETPGEEEDTGSAD